MGPMTDPRIRDFHFHIYFDADEVDRARALAEAAARAFPLPVGHFHTRRVGPHPRGSVQLTVPVERFGEVAQRMTKMADDATARAERQWDKIESIFEARTAKAMHRLGVPSSRDVEALKERIEALSAQIARGARPAARKAAAKGGARSAAGKAAKRARKVAT